MLFSTSTNGKVPLVALIFLLFFSALLFGQETGTTNLQSCISLCESKYGPQGTYRALDPLDSGVTKDCGGSNTTQFSTYLCCHKNATEKRDACKDDCTFYTTDPCYGECESNYNACKEECDKQYLVESETCAGIYLDWCNGVCIENCNAPQPEEIELVCTDYMCKYTKKKPVTSKSQAESIADCAGKKEGDLCGGAKIGCYGTACKILIDYKDAQVELCKGKKIGDACCEPPYEGEVVRLWLHQKGREVVIQRDWLSLTCTWAEYMWRNIGKYNKQTCKYEWKQYYVPVVQGSETGPLAIKRFA